MGREKVIKQKTYFKYTELTNPSPEFAYVLGWLWSDGHVKKDSRVVTLGIKRSDLLEIKPCFDLVGSWSYIENKDRERRQPVSTLSNYDLFLVEFLDSMDFRQKKSLPPEKIIRFLGEGLLPHFLRGLVDGDGCIGFGYLRDSYRTFCVTIFSCFNQDWSWFDTIKKKLNISSSVSLRKRTSGSSSNLSISGSSAKIFCEYIFQDVSYPHLYRKKSVYLEKIEYDKYMKSKSFNGVFPMRGYWAMQIKNPQRYTIKCKDEKEAAEWYDKMRLFLNTGLSYLNFPNRIGEFCRIDIPPVSEKLNDLSLETKKFIFDSLPALNLDSQSDLVKSEILKIIEKDKI